MMLYMFSTTKGQKEASSKAVYANQKSDIDVVYEQLREKHTTYGLRMWAHLVQMGKHASLVAI